MKLVILTVFVLSILLSVSNSTVEAQTTYCYTLTNFCDQVQLTKDGTSGWMGFWDAECNGFLSSVAGKGAHVITRPVDSGTGLPNALTFRFRFFKRDGIFELYGTDGTTLTTFQLNQPFTKVKAPCVFTATNPNKKPSLLGNWKTN